MSLVFQETFNSLLVLDKLKDLSTFQVSSLILLILIIVDTMLGLKVAIKYNRVGSRGFLKFVKKVVLYTTAIISVRLLEVGMLAFITTTLLSQLMLAFLIVSETISILENLTILGVPIPSNFISIIVSNLKIAGFDKVLEARRSNEKDIIEIDDIIKYQLPNFKEKNIRMLLDIKFRTWKLISEQIDKDISGNDSNKERLYYKVLSLIELGFREMEQEFESEKICKECVEKFFKIHQSKRNKLLKKVEEICYSEKSIEDKKDELIDSILVLLYETIVDAYKII
ncbi:phage holin family protein [Clostridium sp. CX1]|uniref:phage holin family protein n=1 Tax=Clostridium sp. CX1 TaxID=2978346 RepID=UPI0021C1EEF8|nr:phage holin family protein [Clostridium sp. CX1]MCT8977793.1 phage holin family protein [Clostridium sp. CX1]